MGTTYDGTRRLHYVSGVESPEAELLARVEMLEEKTQQLEEVLMTLLNKSTETRQPEAPMIVIRGEWPDKSHT